MLDIYSRRILALLQTNSRRPIQEISDLVGLSPTPCWRRIRDMEASGVIRGYAALLDRGELGLDACVLAHVQLARHEEAAVERFEAAMAARPEVTQLYSTTGEADYILKVVVTDIQAYEAFLKQHLFRLPAVVNVRSSVVLRELKNDTALPLDAMP